MEVPKAVQWNSDDHCLCVVVNIIAFNQEFEELLRPRYIEVDIEEDGVVGLG